MRWVIGLGSNLGSRRALLDAAVALLATRVGPVLGQSQIYETEPLGPAQPAYLNTAALLDTALEAHAVLSQCNQIEAALGRERRLRWGPRTVDLDLLWADGLALADDALTVPHPGLTARTFALDPLLELCPDARLPGGEPLRALRARLGPPLARFEGHDGPRQAALEAALAPDRTRRAVGVLRAQGPAFETAVERLREALGDARPARVAVIADTDAGLDVAALY